MRILFVTGTERDLQAGAARATFLLSEAMAKRGHQVTVAWFADVMEHVPRWLRHRNKHLTLPFALISTVAQREQQGGPYDVVHTWSGDACLYGLRKRLRHCRQDPLLISDTHGLEHCWWQSAVEEVKASGQPLPLRQRIAFTVIRLNQVRWAAHLSDHVICHCRSDQEYVVSHGWAGRGKVTCIPHGLPDGYLSPAPGPAGRGRGLLFVSAWEPQKGLLTLRDAYLDILRVRPDTCLSLLGTRRPAQEVLAAFPSDVTPLIDVVPVLSQEGLIQEYLRHDVFLFPSTYEGFGMVVLEAMACGLPIVATPVGGIPDLVEHGVDGFVVPLRDSRAMAEVTLKLLDNPTLREQAGDNARRKARSYSWQRIAGEYEALYARLLAERRPFQEYQG